MPKTDTTTIDTDVMLYFDYAGKVFRIDQGGKTYELNDPMNLGNATFAQLRVMKISGEKFL